MSRQSEAVAAAVMSGAAMNKARENMAAVYLWHAVASTGPEKIQYADHRVIRAVGLDHSWLSLDLVPRGACCTQP